MTINFYLKNNKLQESPIYLLYRNGKTRLTIALGERIAAKDWDAKRQRARKSAPAAVQLNALLDKITEMTLAHHRECQTNQTQLSPQTLSVTLFPNSQTQSVVGLIETLQRYIKEHTVLRTPGTLKVYCTLSRYLLAFEKENAKKLTFSDINLAFFPKFSKFCLEKYAITDITLQKRITTLKSFLNWAAKQELIAERCFAGYHFRTKAVAPKPYLTEAELQNLLNLDLPPYLTRARDVFYFAAWTGLRYGDLSGLKKEQYKDDCLVFTAHKTRESFKLPLLPQAKAILEKYDYQLPVVSNQKMNAFLKDIAKRAALNDKIEKVRYRGAARMEKTQEKWETITCHTARRSFIVNALKRGMPVHIVRAMVGHSDLKTTMRYVSVSENDIAEALKKAWDKNAL